MLMHVASVDEGKVAISGYGGAKTGAKTMVTTVLPLGQVEMQNHLGGCTWRVLGARAVETNPITPMPAHRQNPLHCLRQSLLRETLTSIGTLLRPVLRSKMRLLQLPRQPVMTLLAA